MTLVSAGITDDVILIDDFEGYTAGNRLYAEAAEWGFVSGKGYGALDVSNTESLEGTQSVTSAGTPYYVAQSGTDPGVVDEQTATFAEYPYAPATLRCGYMSSAASDRADIAFAVPETEADFNSNCYRIRGGTGEAPFIRRTVNGTSTELASMSNPLSANTQYDIVPSFQATGSAVDLSLRIWEWDGSAWVEFESEITVTDTDNAHPDSGGVALAFNDATADDAHLDCYRFIPEYRENGLPEVMP